MRYDPSKHTPLHSFLAHSLTERVCVPIEAIYDKSENSYHLIVRNGPVHFSILHTTTRHPDNCEPPKDADIHAAADYLPNIVRNLRESARRKREAHQQARIEEQEAVKRQAKLLRKHGMEQTAHLMETGRCPLMARE